jgi:hypothetical protein
MSALDAFKARIASGDFQAYGPVAGTITLSTILGPRSGSVTGTFAVDGSDSAFSIRLKILGQTETDEDVVVGGLAYSRTNGGAWTQGPASGKTLQGFVGGGIVLTDQGVEAKFGRQLHRLDVGDLTGVNLASFGIAAGPNLDNLVISDLSFWAADDGAPAGLSIDASVDQKVFGLTAHATVTLEMSIDSLSGVTITAPAS